MPRSRLSKLMLALTLGAGVVLLTASPAFAHAVFEGSEPADGTIYPLASPPTSVTMQWGESVGIKLGAVRMYDEHGHMLDIGAPEHPDGVGSQVTASLPHLGAGTYVVTWRVISADTHPVSGAFTFTVGPRQQNVSALATKLLSSENGSKTVGVLYGTDRFVLFSSLIVLLGGAAFVTFVWPAGRRSRRAAYILWAAWSAAIGITLFGFAIEGIYAAGFPLHELLSSTVLTDTLHGRYGETAIARAALLVVAVPLLRVLVSRKNSEARTPRTPPWWWITAATTVGLATLVTVTLASHGTTGRWTGLALPDDTLHLSAVSVWFGGLLMLLVALLPDATTDTLIEALPRYSNFAFVAVIAIFVTGTFQAIRQVGSLHALTSTTYGHLLIIKVTAFGVMIIVAAFSREIVDRTYEPLREAQRARSELVRVGANTSTVDDDRAPEPDHRPFFDPADEVTIRGLRQTVRIEVALAVVILILTALLVDARPAYQVVNGPQILTIKSPATQSPVVWFNLVIQPAASGSNQIHVTTETPEGSVANPLQVTMAITNTAHDIAALTIPLLRLGPGHYVAPAIEIPFAGTWQVRLAALMTPFDESIGTHNVTIR